MKFGSARWGELVSDFVFFTDLSKSFWEPGAEIIAQAPSFS
jgi:hypothetical protein